MSGHLTEDTLIKYAFDLAAEDEQAVMAGHLAECGQCKGELDRVRAKFRALDLLAGDVAVSQELAAQVLTQAKHGQDARATNAHATRWMPRVWMGVAAGVLVVASVLVVNQVRTPEDIGEKFAKGLDEQPTAEVSVAAGKPVTDALGGGRLRPGAVDAVAESERPPFAPASAIELVVLPRRENVQLTIYNSADLTLVRERRNLTLKKGWNWLQFMWANTLIDPTSLSLEPLEHKGEIEVQQLVYPARLKEIGRWLIRSDVEGQAPFEITYFTSGLAWRAFYMGTLSPDEATMHLEGYVRVDNRSGEEYENAQTRLIVGQVHLLDEIAELAKQQYPYGSPMMKGYGWGMMGGMGGFGGMGMDKNRREVWFRNGMMEGTATYTVDLDALVVAKAIEKEGLSEYFLYTIEGTETIPNEWGKRLPSFEADDVAVKNLYRYDEGRWGVQTVRFLSFANDEEHKLGQTPLPDGSVKIYRRAEDDGSLAYAGGTDVKYIPVNEEVELNLGAARYVAVEPVLADFRTDHYQFDGKGNIDGWDEIHTWKITAANTRDIPVKVEVFRDFGTAYWDLEKSGQFDAFEAEDMDTVKFTVDLVPRSEREFTYVLTTYHGTREEAWTKSRQ